MRIALLTFYALLPSLGLADGWAPPADPDPQVILQEANSDTTRGDYEVALAKYLWFHENAVALQPAQSGVRLSFALSNWLALGEVYPPALEKMKQVRDETEKRIRDQERIKVRFEDFHDFVALNRTLRQEQRTAATFRWLDQTDQEDAKRVFNVAEPALIEQKAYQLCGKYVDPERDLSRMGQDYTSGLKMADERFGDSFREFTEKKFLNDATTLVAILVRTDRMAEANQAAAKVTGLVNNPDLQGKLNRQLESALTGIVPKPWP